MKSRVNNQIGISIQSVTNNRNVRNMKKIFKYGLLAVLLVGCESNNKDNVDEQAQSAKEMLKETKSEDRQFGELVISYLDNKDRLHTMRGTDYTDRISYTLSKDNYEIFNIGMYLDYKDLPNIEVLGVTDDQVNCRFEDVEYTLQGFQDGENSVSFEALLDDGRSIPFNVEFDSISTKDFFDLFKNSKEIENPFAEMANAKLPWGKIIKGACRVIAFVGGIAIHEASKLCQEKLDSDTADCIRQGKCARRKGKCSMECIDCPK